jgi:hypothetical protein
MPGQRKEMEVILEVSGAASRDHQPWPTPKNESPET